MIDGVLDETSGAVVAALVMSCMSFVMEVMSTVSLLTQQDICTSDLKKLLLRRSFANFLKVF